MANELDNANKGSDAGPIVGSAATDRLFAGGTVLCDGAMGTMLYARGVFINRCYDELNLSQPELVREIHAEYLQAGAEVVETNTFGANRHKLAQLGMGDRVTELNHRGVKIAREARESAGHEVLIAGSIVARSMMASR